MAGVGCGVRAGVLAQDALTLLLRPSKRNVRPHFLVQEHLFTGELSTLAARSSIPQPSEMRKSAICRHDNAQDAKGACCYCSLDTEHGLGFGG